MTQRQIERKIDQLADRMLGAALAGNRSEIDRLRDEIAKLRRQAVAANTRATA